MPEDEKTSWKNNPMGPAFEKVGITPEFLAKKLRAELNANLTRAFHNKDIRPAILVCPACEGQGIDLKNPRTSKGNPRKCKACKGKGWYAVSPVNYSKPMIAWDTRQKAREDAHKLMGDYPAEKHIFPDKEGNPQNIASLPNLEIANRLLFLIEQALTRKKENGNGSTKD